MRHDVLNAGRPIEVSGGFDDALATGLGWSSIGLGLAELLSPRLVTRSLGMEDSEDLIRLYGLREIAVGAGILGTSGSARAAWLWARVAGDLLDIATVAGARHRPGTPNGDIAALVGVTLVDACCAARLSPGKADPRLGIAPPTHIPRPSDYVRYSDAVEHRLPDEDRVIDAIIGVMAKGGEVVREREGHAYRTSHAKAHGLLRGELSVLPNLPRELRQGLFAERRSYPVVTRLSHVPGEPLDDRQVSCPRGMALKVLEVSGEMLPGHEDETTQDFALDTGEGFISSNAATFLAAIAATEATVSLPGSVKGAASTASQAANAVLGAIGLPSAKLDLFGHPPRHPLAEAYFSQCSVRYGDYIAKLAVFPDEPELSDVAGEDLRIDSRDGVRDAVDEHMREHDATFVVAVQLCTDLQRMPVEDASVVWAEDESPYRPVARLSLPTQSAYDAERGRTIDDGMSFCPAHNLAAHRPLGSIMRARFRAYEVLGRKRRELNGCPVEEPRTVRAGAAGAAGTGR